MATVNVSTAFITHFDAVSSSLSMASGILSLIRSDGESVEGFSTNHKDIMAALWAADELLDQAENRLKNLLEAHRA